MNGRKSGLDGSLRGRSGDTFCSAQLSCFRFADLGEFNTGPNQISLYGRAHHTNGNFMIVSQITRGGMQMQKLEQPNIRKALEGKLQIVTLRRNKLL